MAGRTKYREYTDEDRERARVVWEATGGNASATARETSIPRSTILAWMNAPPPAPLETFPAEIVESVVETFRQDKKSEIIGAAWDLAKAAFDQAKAALPDASAKDAATVAGIAIDKAQLLSGGATERVDVRAILATLPAEVRAAVIALAAESDTGE